MRMQMTQFYVNYNLVILNRYHYVKNYYYYLKGLIYSLCINKWKAQAIKQRTSEIFLRS
jgi:hypothetical protein